MMAFAAQKTLGYLLMPAGLLWLLLGATALVALRRRQRTLAALLGSATLMFALAGNVPLGRGLMARLETRIPPVDLQQAGPFEAIFVMGGGTSLAPSGTPEAGEAGDRLVLAARLWHQGRARFLVASGGGPAATRNLAEETRQIWCDLGVPESAILTIKDLCLNSREEIRAYRRLQIQQGWTRVGLLSSASHLPRAMALADREGLCATPLGADRRGRAEPFQMQDLVPRGEGFHLVHRACWEYLGRWTGR